MIKKLMATKVATCFLQVKWQNKHANILPEHLLKMFKILQ